LVAQHRPDRFEHFRRRAGEHFADVASKSCALKRVVIS